MVKIMSVRKYYCAICENEWPSAFIKRFDIERTEFINNIRKKFSFQCPICKPWLNGILCPSCEKCVPPHANCPECRSLLKPPLAGCRRHH